ncbi:hypothetical protein [Rhizobium sp.]
MLRFAGLVLAPIVAFSVLPLSMGEAGNRDGEHRIKKTSVSRLSDGRDSRQPRHDRRIVVRNVNVVKAVVNVVTRERNHNRPRAYGTYSGSVDVFTQNGVGQWSYGSDSAVRAAVSIVPMAKIIDVLTLKPNGACDMQAGVCIIRP